MWTCNPCERSPPPPPRAPDIRRTLAPRPIEVSSSMRPQKSTRLDVLQIVHHDVLIEFEHRAVGKKSQAENCYPQARPTLPPAKIRPEKQPDHRSHTQNQGKQTIGHGQSTQELSGL